METLFKDRALLHSRYYKSSMNSLMEHYFPMEINSSACLNKNNNELLPMINENDSADETIVTTTKVSSNERIIYDDDEDDGPDNGNERCRGIESFGSKFLHNNYASAVGDRGGGRSIDDDDRDEPTDDEIRLMFYRHCGFSQPELELCEPFNCHADTDPRAIVSLALINSNSQFLSDYANKLPLMCVNVRRFKYTVKALQYASSHGCTNFANLYSFYNDEKTTTTTTDENNDIITLGLNFIIHSDLKSLNLRDQPNLRFSNFLHLLKLSGSMSYIFGLAEILKFNVDLVYINENLWHRRYRKRYSKSQNRESVFRYKYAGIDNNRGIGYLTAVYVKSKNGENEWFVYVHSKSLLPFV